jgi:uracil-DNA glycosylase family 4
MIELANCQQCQRLQTFLAQIRVDHPHYHAAPVVPFGDHVARLLIVGLAPGLHGANRTGRPFTGDYAGLILYRTLYQTGFSTQPESLALTDSLQLRNCRITNAVKCVPPANKPTTHEIRTCNAFLTAELQCLPRSSVVLALGHIAHRAVVQAFNLKLSAWPFQHAREHYLPNQHWLIDSYHCSRYNTQTRRLTEAMFLEVMQRCRNLVDQLTHD